MVLVKSEADSSADGGTWTTLIIDVSEINDYVLIYNKLIAFSLMPRKQKERNDVLISDEQIRSSVTVKDCLEVVELAFQDLAAGKAVDSPRERIFVETPKDAGVYALSRLCGAVPRFGVAALRITSHPRGSSRDPLDNHFILLFNVENGRLLALLQGFTLSGLRLGATTALVAKYLAPKGELEVGVFGSGKSKSQPGGLAAVTKIHQVKVYSPNPSHCSLFCEEMGKKLGLAVIPHRESSGVVQGSDIVLGASNAWEPVYDGNLIKMVHS